MDDTPCLVMTTLGTEDEAEALATALVEARLAACVQVQRVRSVYRWQGEVRHEPEWLLTAKTRRLRFAALKDFIRGRHSDEVPEIVQVPITEGHVPYLDWLRAETSGG